MKFTCNAKDIAGAVAVASKVVNAHTTVPILNNVLVAAQQRARQRARHRPRTDAGEFDRCRSAGGRLVHRAGAIVQRIPRQLAGGQIANAGDDESRDATLRTLELRVFYVTGARISAACPKGKAAACSEWKPRPSARRSTP